MERPKSLLFVLLALGLGFGFGKIAVDKPQFEQVLQTKIQPELSLLVIEKIEGDLLKANVSGPVRVIWAEEKFAEGDGDIEIPLSQIKTENDLNYDRFAFVGNAKTGKFYPSDSYWARGVEVKHRRFFHTKEAAIIAGFVASKGVK